MGNRINTVMQPCFFQLAGRAPRRRGHRPIKQSVEQAYGQRGGRSSSGTSRPSTARSPRFRRVELPRRSRATVHDAGGPRRRPRLREAGDGPADRRGGRPAASERSAGRRDLPDRHRRLREAGHRPGDPIWDPDICIDCGKCAIVCPHATIRMKVYEPERPGRRARHVPVQALPLQGHPGVPADDPGGARRLHRLRRVRRRLPGQEQDRGPRKAINMEPVLEHRDRSGSTGTSSGTIPPLDASCCPTTR